MNSSIRKTIPTKRKIPPITRRTLDPRPFPKNSLDVCRPCFDRIVAECLPVFFDLTGMPCMDRGTWVEIHLEKIITNNPKIVKAIPPYSCSETILYYGLGDIKNFLLVTCFLEDVGCNEDDD